MVKFEYKLVGLDLRQRDLADLQASGDEGFECIKVMPTSNVNSWVALMMKEIELDSAPAKKVEKKEVKKVASKKDQQQIKKEVPMEKEAEELSEE